MLGLSLQSTSDQRRSTAPAPRLGYLAIVVAFMATTATAWWDSQEVDAGQTVVVVLDDSGSMERRMEDRQRRMDVAKKSLDTVLRGLPYDTKVGILALNSRASGSHWIVPVGSPDPNRWSAALQAVRANGGTPLGYFMKEGADELLKLRAKEPFESYRLLVVTDGEASDGPFLASIMPDLLSRGLSLDVIGVAMKEQHSLARLAHSYRAANDAQSLTQALGEVFAETGGDDSSASADFELISGLPDQVASVILSELTTPRNDPIGQLEVDSNDFPLGATPTSLPGATGPATPNTQGGQVRSVGVSAISAVLGTICCFGGFIFFISVVLAIVLGAVKKNSRS